MSEPRAHNLIEGLTGARVELTLLGGTEYAQVAVTNAIEHIQQNNVGLETDQQRVLEDVNAPSILRARSFADTDDPGLRAPATEATSMWYVIAIYPLLLAAVAMPLLFMRHTPERSISYTSRHVRPPSGLRRTLTKILSF